MMIDRLDKYGGVIILSNGYPALTNSTYQVVTLLRKLLETTRKDLSMWNLLRFRGNR
ncbi:hypothetical protein [Shimazuella alba]|uniref:Uncharacterized protein n=1 Tax=Shimazuella alba TaxID=2690964 RepID=A0A6I4VQZ8_9BACL|nr:hypothetical protein [Shimazuella alba]MXQ52831.1 hypothetical protein [Shimazuella alba]